MYAKTLAKRAPRMTTQCPLCRDLIPGTVGDLTNHIADRHTTRREARLGDIIWLDKHNAVYRGRYYKP